MADNIVTETGFSPAQLKTLTEIIVAAFAQERARNQVPPTSKDVLRASPPTSYKNYRKRYDSPDLGIQRVKLNLEEPYNEEKKKSRGFGNYWSSHGDCNRNIGHATTNQSGNSNTVGAVDKKARREFTNLGRSLSTVMRSCIENGVLSKLPINLARPIRGRFVDQSCEYHQCKGHSTDSCFRLQHDIQDLIDSGMITKSLECSEPMPGNH
ncbi:hypothetical protein JCGZ_19499 [Jatropha curcas]|uniref:Gag-pol polyprotein n=1 Tax=Jatropha curcas TaxID=180498 RepID=A0A067LK52_JATCU|nr:hypothetical protein JCGZ_19499 [Jatropha curcas]